MISVPSPVRTIDHGDQLNIVVMIIISPIKFGRGGRARLAKLATNHHVAVRGNKVCIPRARAIVRLCVRS